MPFLVKPLPRDEGRSNPQVVVAGQIAIGSIFYSRGDRIFGAAMIGAGLSRDQRCIGKNSALLKSEKRKGRLIIQTIPNRCN